MLFSIDLCNACMRLFKITPTNIFLVLPFCFFSLSHDFIKSLKGSAQSKRCSLQYTLLKFQRQKCQTPLLKGYKIYKLKMTVP